MPRVAFESLPDDARVWVFGAANELDPKRRDALLDGVDEYLAQWHAHGEPLVSARDFRDGWFLAVGVDQSAAGASGCSIDGLYRALARVETDMGTKLLGAGRVYYRDSSGRVITTSRAEFSRLGREGHVGPDTPVFDTSVTSAAAWREEFERPARQSWHGRLIQAAGAR